MNDVRMPLTPRQSAALDVIRDCLDERGYPPSVREMCDRLGLSSSSSAASLLSALEEKGWVRRVRNQPRAIEVLFR